MCRFSTVQEYRHIREMGMCRPTQTEAQTEVQTACAVEVTGTVLPAWDAWCLWIYITTKSSQYSLGASADCRTLHMLSCMISSDCSSRSGVIPLRLMSFPAGV
jgi:hypothetical protein